MDGVLQTVRSFFERRRLTGVLGNSGKQGKPFPWKIAFALPFPDGTMELSEPNLQESNHDLTYAQKGDR